MKTQIIQLENHDDLITARDKMTWSKAPRILLVWPRKGRLLERSVDLLILQRYAQSLGAQLGIVSNSLHIQNQARELGIPCFRNSAQAQRQAWRRFRGRKRLNLRLLDRKPAAASLREKFKEISTNRAWTPEILPVRVAAFSLGVVAVILMALVFIPSAQIELIPARESQQLTFEMRASPNIGAVNLSGGIPAYETKVIVEGSDEERSSGIAVVPEGQARGKVQLTNLGEDELTILAGSVVATTGDGIKRYATRIDARVPAGVGSQVEVDVLAIVPGEDGNVEAGAVRALEGPQGLLVTVDNPAALFGGTDRESPGPSEADFERLRERLVNSLRETAGNDLERELGNEGRLLESTVQVASIVQENATPGVGMPSDFARLSLQIEFTAWYVREEDLQSVARTALDANALDGYQAEPNPVDIVFLDPGRVDEEGNVRWEISAGRRVRAIVNSDQAARQIVGQTPEEASRILAARYVLEAPAQFKLRPGWWFRLPFLSFRIEVTVR